MDSVKDRLNELAYDFFGISYIYPYQRLVISNILSAAEKTGDALPGQIVILPTGYGKSLCYMLPALLLEKPTIVLSPLLSLVKDQERRLKKAGIEVSVLTGSINRSEKNKAVEDAKSGKCRILLTNPESLYPLAKKCFSPGKTGNPVISHIVVDEAHTIPEWGETFRDALLKTGEIIDIIKPECVTAFTATATSSIFSKIRNLIFGENQVNIIAGSPDRSNIFYSVVPTICMDRDTSLYAEKCKKPLVIFCTSRTDTELTSRMLRSSPGSDDVFFYHAGLEKNEKEKIEKWFFSSENGILAATCAYGLGIDKPDIRTVIHRGPPGSVEAYLQESGRAGRDGLQSEAVLLYNPAAFAGKNPMGKADADVPPPCSIMKEFQFSRQKQMIDYARNTAVCRREKLLSFFSDEIPYCSGCDICRGTKALRPAGADEIINVIRANNRKLTGKEISQILTGFGSDRIIKIWHGFSESYCSLEAWEPDEIREALLNLEKSGEIKKGKYLWKNIYSV